MTLLSLDAKILDRIFIAELIRLIGRKSPRASDVCTFGIRAILTQLILSKLALPTKKILTQFEKVILYRIP